MSDRYLKHGGRLLIVGDQAAMVCTQDTWKACDDRTLKAGRQVVSTDTSSHPIDSEVQGDNGSISWEPLFKPLGRLMLTLLATCIDIATL